jgi:hypothetical protein
MLFKLKIFPLGLLPLVLVSLLGCNHFSTLGLAVPETVPIGKLKYPSEGNGVVKLKGKVSDRAPFLDGSAYLLQDKTGGVWIRTAQNPPAKGEELLIEGKVEYQSIPLEQQEFGGLYVTEIRQLESVPPTPLVNPQPSPAETPPNKPSVEPLKEPFLPHKENKKD